MIKEVYSIMLFAKSRILITDGTGTLGYELSKQLLDFNCTEIVIYSRNEVAQVEMKRIYPKLTYIIGDIRDKSAVKKALKNIDIYLEFLDKNSVIFLLNKIRLYSHLHFQ